VLESNLVALLSPLPAEVPEGITVRGSRAAREALGEALPLALTWQRDAVLAGAACHWWPLWLRNFGSVIEGGRAAPYAGWSFTFVSRSSGGACRVRVPGFGRVTQTAIPGGAGQRVAALDDGWLDSPDWWAALVRWCNATAPGMAPCVLTAELWRPGSSWAVSLELAGERHDVVIGPTGAVEKR
jgi:hypothetical protein